MFDFDQVQHPAAKMLVLASQQQEQECGDGTNFVLVFAGALLERAEDLLRMVNIHAAHLLFIFIYRILPSFISLVIIF